MFIVLSRTKNVYQAFYAYSFTDLVAGIVVKFKSVKLSVYRLHDRKSEHFKALSKKKHFFRLLDVSYIPHTSSEVIVIKSKKLETRRIKLQPCHRVMIYNTDINKDKVFHCRCFRLRQALSLELKGSP